MAERPPTDLEKLKHTLTEIGVPFQMTDDSEESELEEDLNTVIELHGSEGGRAYFMFRRDGSYKDFDCF